MRLVIALSLILMTTAADAEIVNCHTDRWRVTRCTDGLVCRTDYWGNQHCRRADRNAPFTSVR
jgi:hypothetical protein